MMEKMYGKITTFIIADYTTFCILNVLQQTELVVKGIGQSMNFPLQIFDDSSL